MENENRNVIINTKENRNRNHNEVRIISCLQVNKYYTKSDYVIVNI